MSSFFRLLKIIHTVGRFRLDKLLKTLEVPLHFRLLLGVFSLYPEPSESRGKCLKAALEELGPIFIKFGQLLSTRPDVVPHDIARELNELQDNVKPFDSATFRSLVEQALGDNVHNIFSDYDETPLASASVAQVHTAKLLSGENVIIKVVRPGIEEIIQQDITLLRLLASFVERMSNDGKRLRPVEIVEDYKHTIFDELNLSLEAANASQLRRNFEKSDDLYVPQVFWEYTKNNIMVMERIYGIPVGDIDALKQQNTDLKILAERGVEIFFTQVFEHNFFHADMHPGNVFVSHNTPENPSYIAVDMAIMGSLTREDQYYLARNLLAMFRRDYRQVAELHVSSGWVPKETSISGFEAAIRTVCEPIFEKPLKDISFGEALITLFKTAQRFNMPVQPQLVLLQKTLLNIEGLGRQLYPELNLWDTAHPFLEKWIKNRYHPRTLWKEFKYNAPEWLEKLPQMPHLALESIQAVKDTSNAIQEIKEFQREETRKKHRLQLRRATLGLATVAVAIWQSWASLPNITTESWIILALAAGIFAL